MPDRFDQILHSTVGQTAGVLTLTSSILGKVYEWITMEQINGLLEFLLAVGGILFLFYNIQGKRLDNKLKRKNLKDEK